jgi:hypothetical protein
MSPVVARFEHAEKAMTMSACRGLLDRLDVAKDDLGLPLTLGGPRFAYRPEPP